MATTRLPRAWLGLDKLFVRLFRKLLSLWIRATVLPEDSANLGIDPRPPIIYVLEAKSFSNRLVLEQACIVRGLPRPSSRPTQALPVRSSVIYLSAGRPRFSRRPGGARHRELLTSLTDALANDTDLNVQLVPVSIFWGRSPDKEGQWLKIMFSDTWAVAGRIRKFFIILLHGRNILVQISPPVSLRGLMGQGLGTPQTVRKLLRVLGVHFRQLRTATIGPDLSHRRNLAGMLLKTRDVRSAIEEEMRRDAIARATAEARARNYVNEIAADYSYPVILLADRLLKRLWDRLYDGVQVNDIEPLQRLAPGNGIVYVPCHRSHIDYLLLSYVLHRAGLVPPHVAAGINLNLPLVGALLRRSGAFFMRRSFKGNPLYAAVFREYLSLNLAKGVSVEYFVEGGRSRTGRSLQPRMGMLSMTVTGYLRHPQRPLMFVPVYVGYERLIEGRSYTAELQGATKRTESLLGLWRSLGVLRERFGKVHLNFGEPIVLDRLLDDRYFDWREDVAEGASSPPWLADAVEELARRIMVNINRAADVNPINLLALALLATPRQAMGEAALVEHVDLYAALLARTPYSAHCTITQMNGEEAIAHGEALGVLRRNPNELGDIIYLDSANAVLMTYFRNNVLHLMTLPALVACCFVNARTLARQRIGGLIAQVYPFLRAELFLPWSGEELAEAVERQLEGMVELGLLDRGPDRDQLHRPPIGSRAGIQLMLLAESVIHMLERFYIVVVLLLEAGSGNTSRDRLERHCQLMAQRFSSLYGVNAPEFYDKSLFQNFVRTLGEMGMLRSDENGLLVYGDELRAAYEDAKILLSEQVRDGVLRVTQGVSLRESG
jgi:glycerol-3-phosphate O-acyltransferase